MGIKKKCREINQAKNRFLEWLKDRKAEDIEVFEGQKEDGDGWDYYRHVSAFVGDTLYSVYFTIWNDTVKIRYSYGKNEYDNMSVDEFYRAFLTE
jgi:hypothetical protein